LNEVNKAYGEIKTSVENWWWSIFTWWFWYLRTMSSLVLNN
jgi:hypothetical protein